MYTMTPKGVVDKYAVIANIYNSAIELCNDIPDVFGPDTVFYGGYIANEARKAVSAGEVIELSNGESVLVTENTNKYTYNDAGRNIVIEIGDFLAEDAYYAYYECDSYGCYTEYTPVVVRMVDGFVIDIYTSNERQMVEGELPEV